MATRQLSVRCKNLTNFLSPLIADYTVKNYNRIPGFPWNLSFLVLENNHCC
jgi:hypothetical protein